MDELKKEKNRLALEKVELLDKISLYQSREDLNRDDKQDALEELNDRLKELDDKLTQARQAYNIAVSQEKHEIETVKYEQARNRRESMQKYETNKAKYEQMRNEKRNNEDLLMQFISQNESARNELMKGLSIEDIKNRHAGEIEAFEKKLNSSVENNPVEPQNDKAKELDDSLTPRAREIMNMTFIGKEGYRHNRDLLAEELGEDHPYVKNMDENLKKIPEDSDRLMNYQEQQKEEQNIAGMPENDVEASDFTSRVIADFNKELEQQEANNVQNQLNDASKDMENTLVVSNILQSKQAENEQDEVDFNVEQPHENTEPEEYEGNNGKTLFEKAKEKWNGVLSTEGEERKTVKKIATGGAIVAAVVATAKIATMVLNPLLGAALTGGAAYLGANYMKGRKGLK